MIAVSVKKGLRSRKLNELADRGSKRIHSDAQLRSIRYAQGI